MDYLAIGTAAFMYVSSSINMQPCLQNKVCSSYYPLQVKAIELIQELESKNQPINPEFFTKHPDLADKVCEQLTNMKLFHAQQNLKFPLSIYKNQAAFDMLSAAVLAKHNNPQIKIKEIGLLGRIDKMGICNYTS